MQMKRDSISNNNQKQGATNTNANIPSFLVKTYDIINDPELDDIISWNADGNGFIVRQVNKFSD